MSKKVYRGLLKKKKRSSFESFFFGLLISAGHRGAGQSGALSNQPTTAQVIKTLLLPTAANIFSQLVLLTMELLKQSWSCWFTPSTKRRVFRL